MWFVRRGCHVGPPWCGVMPTTISSRRFASLRVDEVAAAVDAEMDALFAAAPTALPSSPSTAWIPPPSERSNDRRARPSATRSAPLLTRHARESTRSGPPTVNLGAYAVDSLVDVIRVAATSRPDTELWAAAIREWAFRSARNDTVLARRDESAWPAGGSKAVAHVIILWDSLCRTVAKSHSAVLSGDGLVMRELTRRTINAAADATPVEAASLLQAIGLSGLWIHDGVVDTLVDAVCSALHQASAAAATGGPPGASDLAALLTTSAETATAPLPASVLPFESWCGLLHGVARVHHADLLGSVRTALLVDGLWTELRRAVATTSSAFSFSDVSHMVLLEWLRMVPHDVLLLDIKHIVRQTIPSCRATMLATILTSYLMSPYVPWGYEFASDVLARMRQLTQQQLDVHALTRMLSHWGLGGRSEDALRTFSPDALFPESLRPVLLQPNRSSTRKVYRRANNEGRLDDDDVEGGHRQLWHDILSAALQGIAMVPPPPFQQQRAPRSGLGTAHGSQHGEELLQSVLRIRANSGGVSYLPLPSSLLPMALVREDLWTLVPELCRFLIAQQADPVAATATAPQHTATTIRCLILLFTWLLCDTPALAGSVQTAERRPRFHRGAPTTAAGTLRRKAFLVAAYMLRQAGMLKHTAAAAALPQDASAEAPNSGRVWLTVIVEPPADRATSAPRPPPLDPPDSTPSPVVSNKHHGAAPVEAVPFNSESLVAYALWRHSLHSGVALRIGRGREVGRNGVAIRSDVLEAHQRTDAEGDTWAIYTKEARRLVHQCSRGGGEHEAEGAPSAGPPPCCAFWIAIRLRSLEEGLQLATRRPAT